MYTFSKSRRLDHLVLAVHDLDAAGAHYEKLGFLVGSRNRHPWGTENRIVQFPGIFLELITVGEGAEIPPHERGVFSFGAFVRDSLKKREGCAMLVLESQDAAADKAAFDQAGIGGFATFDFARKGRRPDGSEIEVSFSLAFAVDPLAPECGFFVCQQHRPENFWNVAMQSHPNGVTALTEVTMVAKDPADHAEFLSAFTGVRAYSATSAGLRFESPRGILSCLSEEAFAFEFGCHAPGTGPRFAAMTVKTKEFEAFETRATNAGLVVRADDRICVIPSDSNFGFALRCIAESEA